MIEEQLSKRYFDPQGESIQNKLPLSGGCSYPSYILDTDRSQYFVKFSSTASPVFHKEANGLKALKKDYQFVPQVFFVDDNFLVLEAIKKESAKETFWIELAKGLATMHKQSHDSFGFSEDNFIGRAKQVNTSECTTWGEFFWQTRLDYKLRELKKVGLYQLDSNTTEQLKTLTVNSLNEKTPSIAPLHGDLWSGNVFCGEGQSPWLIDPAFYHGDPEADLAMTECFGGFPPTFYSTYMSHYPLQKGYDFRKHIYNLYHMLNHLLIFGSSYQETVQQILRQLLKA